MANRLLSRRAFIIGGITTLSYLYYDLHSIAVKQYTIAIPDLPKEFEGFTILHLTDLHSKEYGEGQKQLLNLINRKSFDIVVMTGDLVDKSNPDTEPAMALVKRLKSRPIFFVPGNHEWWTGYEIKPQLESQGVRTLENKAFKFDKGSSHIWLMGVDDPYLGRDRLNRVVDEVIDSSPKILLAHAPNIFPMAVNSNVELVLVGHTHGGQIRLPLMGAVVVPGQELFPKFDYGQFTTESTTMIINCGLGESVLPIRFNSRPEIVLIKLVSLG